MNILTLYHGTASDFDEEDVTRGKGYKDFGKGFYLTGDKEHAIRMAKRVRIIEIAKRKRMNVQDADVSAYVYEHQLDFDLLKNSQFNIKEFCNGDVIEWVDFVLANRQSPNKTHDYDVVIGATADDDTRISLDTYRMGAYGKVGSDTAKQALVPALELDVFPKQTFIATQGVADMLKLVQKEVV